MHRPFRPARPAEARPAEARPAEARPARFATAIPALWTIVAVGVLAASVAISCQDTGGPTRSFSLPAVNGSGVSGSVTLTQVAPGKTRVEIGVDPNGNPDMPAHIHAGACPKPIPQPKHPLTAVIAGRSVTEVPASLAELTAGDQTINLHRSNEDLKATTACVDLR